MCYACWLLINSKDKNRFLSAISLCLPRSTVFVFFNFEKKNFLWQASKVTLFPRYWLLKEWKISWGQKIKETGSSLSHKWWPSLPSLWCVAGWPQLLKRSRSVAAGESEFAQSGSQVSWWHRGKVRFTTSEARPPALRQKLENRTVKEKQLKFFVVFFWGWVKGREQMFSCATESHTLRPRNMELSLKNTEMVF